MAYFGERVRALREQAGLSQPALATLIDKSRQSVSKIERGQQSVLSEDVWILSSALECQPGDLFERP
jgi:transcriptional regulator with XRE-family HTH domain